MSVIYLLKGICTVGVECGREDGEGNERPKTKQKVQLQVKLDFTPDPTGSSRVWAEPHFREGILQPQGESLGASTRARTAKCLYSPHLTGEARCRMSLGFPLSGHPRFFG